MTGFIVIADILEKLILLLLLALSVWSVAIMVERRRFFKTQQSFDFEHLKTLIENQNLGGLRAWCEGHKTLLAGSISAMIKVKPISESIDRAMASFIKQNRDELDRGLVVLATLGANAPFVGLFGTVLGIIKSFAFLGSQSGSAAVMSGVSQALVATAVGLFVAIPAVVAYNNFNKSTKDLLLKIESLRDLYISNLK